VGRSWVVRASGHSLHRVVRGSFGSFESGRSPQWPLSAPSRSRVVRTSSHCLHRVVRPSGSCLCRVVRVTRVVRVVGSAVASVCAESFAGRSWVVGTSDHCLHRVVRGSFGSFESGRSPQWLLSAPSRWSHSGRSGGSGRQWLLSGESFAGRSRVVRGSLAPVATACAESFAPVASVCAESFEPLGSFGGRSHRVGRQWLLCARSLIHSFTHSLSSSRSSPHNPQFKSVRTRLFQ